MRTFERIFNPIELPPSIPVNKLMSHAASYIFFLILILLNILNPDDNKQEIDLNWYNYLMPFFSLGFLFIDVEQMLDHARAVKIGKRVNCLEATVARIRGFFGNKYFAYREVQLDFILEI